MAGRGNDKYFDRGIYKTNGDMPAESACWICRDLNIYAVHAMKDCPNKNKQKPHNHLSKSCQESGRGAGDRHRRNSGGGRRK